MKFYNNLNISLLGYSLLALFFVTLNAYSGNSDGGNPPSDVIPNSFELTDQKGVTFSTLIDIESLSNMYDLMAYEEAIAYRSDTNVLFRTAFFNALKNAIKSYKRDLDSPEQGKNWNAFSAVVKYRGSNYFEIQASFKEIPTRIVYRNHANTAEVALLYAENDAAISRVVSCMMNRGTWVRDTHNNLFKWRSPGSC